MTLLYRARDDWSFDAADYFTRPCQKGSAIDRIERRRPRPGKEEEEEERGGKAIFSAALNNIVTTHNGSRY